CPFLRDREIFTGVTQVFIPSVTVAPGGLLETVISCRRPLIIEAQLLRQQQAEKKKHNFIKWLKYRTKNPN
ncbi:MAG TPA: hypothetical protein VN457_07355, partial [Chlamydiales bacterium]|nr:hypothetical protein [Chlamydiales bacterium]